MKPLHGNNCMFQNMQNTKVRFFSTNVLVLICLYGNLSARTICFQTEFVIICQDEISC